jgi:hypothetical protein
MVSRPKSCSRQYGAPRLAVRRRIHGGQFRFPVPKAWCQLSHGSSTANRIFTQEDPIGLAGGLNLYGFAAGDPINSSDPFGLYIESDKADGDSDYDLLVVVPDDMPVEAPQSARAYEACSLVRCGRLTRELGSTRPRWTCGAIRQIWELRALATDLRSPGPSDRPSRSVYAGRWTPPAPTVPSSGCPMMLIPRCRGLRSYPNMRPWSNLRHKLNHGPPHSPVI